MLWRKLNFGSYGQWVAVIIVSISSFVTGTTLGWSSAAIPHIKNGSAGFTLTDYEMSWMVAISSIGMGISPIPCGYLLDKIGRSRTLLLFASMMLVAWLMLAFSESIIPIYSARFMCGLWGGIEYTTVLLYVCEVSEPKLRGSLGSIGEVLLFLGVLFESLIAGLPYRIIAFCSMLPVVILFLGLLLFVPESPYFYLMKKDRKTAMDVFKWLRGSCSEEAMDCIEDTVNEQLKHTASFSDIFTSPVNLKTFIVVLCLKMTLGSCSIVLLMPYSSLILPDSWVSTQNSFSILCIVWVISCILSAMIMNKINRRTFLFMASVVAVIATSSTAIWFYLRDQTAVDTNSTNWVPLLLLSISGVFETGGIFTVPNIIKGEIFPINIKSKASALCAVATGFFEAVTTYFFYSITDNIGLYFNFVKIAITAAFCIIITKFALIETKDKSLEEIQTILNKKNDGLTFRKITLMTAPPQTKPSRY